MSEHTGGYGIIYPFAIITGVLAYFFLYENGTMFEIGLAGLTVLFCLGLLIKQRWALVGINLVLLIGVVLYFTRMWYLPIIEEDPGLIAPNLLKMLVCVVLFIIFGRQRVEFSIS